MRTNEIFVISKKYRDPLKVKGLYVYIRDVYILSFSLNFPLYRVTILIQLFFPKAFLLFFLRSSYYPSILCAFTEQRIRRFSLKRSRLRIEIAIKTVSLTLLEQSICTNDDTILGVIYVLIREIATILFYLPIYVDALLQLDVLKHKT